MELILLIASGACQVVLAGMGFYVTIIPIRRADKTKEFWFKVGFSLVSLATLALLAIIGARSDAAQQEIKATLQALLHGDNSVLPSQIRIVTTDHYDAIETDKYIIVRPSSKAATMINLPTNPKIGDIVDVKNANATNCQGAITVNGNGNKIDDKDEFDMRNCGEEIGVIFDGEAWNVR